MVLTPEKNRFWPPTWCLARIDGTMKIESSLFLTFFTAESEMGF
jgi:hypothetical protein